ncbi:hypothetical protein FHU30_000360 [Actinomadura rupiterrae]|nr:hypothetical protein [Actinomadura rupiterrae]
MGSTATALVTGGTAVLTGTLTAVVGVVTTRLGHSYERRRAADAREAEHADAAAQRVRDALRSMDNAVVDLGVTIRLIGRLKQFDGEVEELRRRITDEYRTVVREIQAFLDAAGHDPKLERPLDALRAEVRRAWLHGLGESGKQDPRSAAEVDDELQKLLGDVGRALTRGPSVPAPRPGGSGAGAAAPVPSGPSRAGRPWRRWRGAPPTRPRGRRPP